MLPLGKVPVVFHENRTVLLPVGFKANISATAILQNRTELIPHERLRETSCLFRQQQSPCRPQGVFAFNCPDLMPMEDTRRVNSKASLVEQTARINSSGQCAVDLIYFHQHVHRFNTFMQLRRTNKNHHSTPTYLIYAMTVRNDNSIDSLTSLAQIPAR